jgi:hypothetical protein
VIEFILEGLLEVDNLKRPQCQALWNSMWHAREFLERLPFWQMRPDDRLSRGAATIAVGIGGGRTSAMGPQVLAQRGRVYAIYLPKASPTGELDLSATTRCYTERWYNPLTGVFEGDPSRKSGGRRRRRANGRPIGFRVSSACSYVTNRTRSRAERDTSFDKNQVAQHQGWSGHHRASGNSR